MSLIAILISLALEKFLPAIEPVRKLGWFAQFSDWLRQRLHGHAVLRGIPALLLSVLLPMVVVAIIYMLFDDILVLLGFLFGIVVLTYCLGPHNPLYAVNRFVDASDRDESDAANEALDSLLEHIPSKPNQLYHEVVNVLLVETHERITGVLFWFIVLGPIGAVMYRLSLEQAVRESALSREDNPEFSRAALKLHALLAWIPARLMALAYAVMGSFTHALKVWQPEKDLPSPGDDNEPDQPVSIEQNDSRQLLIRVGLGAMQQEDSNDYELHTVREAFGLCSRSLIAWLTILGLLTLAGWIA